MNEREQVDRRTASRRRRVDRDLKDYDFSPSFHMIGEINLFTVCEKCGVLLVLTREVSPEAIVAHWRRHHPLLSVLDRLARWRQGSLRDAR